MIRRLLDFDGHWDNDGDAWWQPLFWPAVYAAALISWEVVTR